MLSFSGPPYAAARRSRARRDRSSRCAGTVTPFTVLSSPAGAAPPPGAAAPPCARALGGGGLGPGGRRLGGDLRLLAPPQGRREVGGSRRDGPGERADVDAVL